MRKGYDIIGLRVIGLQDADDLGKVLDLVFNPQTDACLGLVMQEGGLLHEAQVVPWSEIQTIGPHAVMVKSAASRVGASSVPELRDAMQQASHLSGDRFVTTEGNQLGTFGDVYLDEATGRVLGYEMSGGFVSDTVSGKRYLPASVGAEVGRDTILVSPEAEAILQNQANTDPGGLKGVTRSATDKAAGLYDTAKSKVTETYANVAAASIATQKDFVVGKVASHSVFLPLGSVGPVSVTTALTSAAATSSPLGMDLVDRDLDVETTELLREGTIGGVTASESVAAMPPLERRAADVSAPGLNFDEVEPATILDPLGERSEAQAGYGGVVVSSPSSNTAAEHGPLLVAQGQTITREHAETAERDGILHQLVLAAGGGALTEQTQNAQASAENAAIGKVAGCEVRLPDGSILVAPGMTITQDAMETAKQYGRQNELIAAAGVGQAQQSANVAGEKATQLLDTAKERGAQLMSAAQERKAQLDADNQRKRINHALGRPITRILLARDDTVILNVGDIITNRAVNAARENGVLDTLLSSVYDTEPQIHSGMMSATQSGEAALPSQVPPTTGQATPPEQNTPPTSPQPASTASPTPAALAASAVLPTPPAPAIPLPASEEVAPLALPAPETETPPKPQFS